MRILHVSDTHLGVDRWFRGAPRGWRRADDHAAALRKALEEPADLVIHTGDLFDRSLPPPRVVAEAGRILAGAAAPVLLLPGNHDRRGLRHHFPDGIPGVVIADGPAAVDLAGVRIAVVPWCADAPRWTAAAESLDGDLLACHQSFDGARVPGHVFRAGRQAETVGRVPARFRQVLCGHIHPRQAVRLGRAEIVHPGSAERTSFSERDEPKGYVLWEDGRWRFVDLPTRPMVVVRGPADLDRVTAGALVHVVDPELEDAAFARGGWLTPRRGAPAAQIPLFP